MDYTSEVYIKLISETINESAKIEYIDFEKINQEYFIKLCMIHKNATIIYTSLKKHDNVPKDLLKILKDGFMTLVMNHANKKTVQDILVLRFAKTSIRFAIIKGLTIAQYYPDPELRTMGDIDILVAKEDFEEAGEVMKEVGGIKDEEQSDPGVARYQLKNEPVEVHASVAYHKNMSGRFDYENFFSDMIENSTRKGAILEINPDYNFIFMIYHMAQHFYYSGCGVKMITDVAVMIQALRDELDWNKVMETLDKIRLKTFTLMTFNLVEYWFKIKAPVSLPEMKEKNIEIISKYILEAGVFGKEKLNNDAAQLRKQNQITKTREGSMLRWVFPGYRYMRESSEWFRGKPAIMLPLAYYERIIRNAEKRGGVMKWGRKLKNTRERLSEHEDVVKIMGLE